MHTSYPMTYVIEINFSDIQQPLLIFSNLVCSVAQVCPTLCDLTDCSPRLHWPWNSPGKNTGTGCHFLLQGIFPAQGSNPHFLSSALAGGFFTTEPPEEPHSRGARSQRYYSPIKFYSGTKKRRKSI